MIKISNLSKSFGEIKAVDQISLTIEDGQVFGLLGTNGAGKSTLLRMITGVIRPEEGQIQIDGQDVWDNPEAKASFFYISDDQFYFPNSRPRDLAAFYKDYYPEFDETRFRKYLEKFQLDANRKIRTFSKGMKKQLSILCGICANTKYLICDETFDGLDPVMRQGMKSLFALEMDERGLTPIIASHNLRELEDICDHIGLLHRGGVVLSQDLEDLKCNLVKVQCVLPEDVGDTFLAGLQIMKLEKHGRLLSMTVRGQREDVLAYVGAFNPAYVEALPLSLEEIFISETEVIGYDIKNLIF
ncbi:MAG: ABC transporter ATP-binding protein [Dorea sp.]|nr:ABC transporter ATP-binding protein [Dorea sp.]